jgi:hypothetical protein
MPDCPSVDEAVTVKVPLADGRMYSVPLPSQYAFADRPPKASVGVDGAELSTFAVFDAPDVP